MNDETVLPAEISDSPVTEPVAAENQETVAPTEILDMTEVTEATEAVVIIDYTPVIYDATSTLASVILAAALMIVGCLIAFKLWEVPHK